MASIKLIDDVGHEFEFNDLNDNDLYQLMNLAQVANNQKLNKYTLVSRCTRVYPGAYKSLVTSLQIGKPPQGE